MLNMCDAYQMRMVCYVRPSTSCHVLSSQMITNHVTYRLNQQGYQEVLQDLLFKADVLKRLMEKDAYQPIVEEMQRNTGMSKSVVSEEDRHG